MYYFIVILMFTSDQKIKSKIHDNSNNKYIEVYKS